MKRVGLLGIATLLSACTAGTTSKLPVATVGPPIPTVAMGLDRVIGQSAGNLQALFGAPDLDVREATARKLQYASSICVLDAYLYPPAQGREPIVRHVDARLPNGDDFDRASCIAALSRRKAAQ